MITFRSTGLVYRNPKPYLRAVNAWHPTLVLAEDELIATFDLGQAVESLDYRVHISRSRDQGQTWDEPAPLFDDSLIQHPTRRSTHSARIRRISDGQLVAIIGRFYRDDPEQGVVNHDNMGLVPMEMLFARSDDDGRTWRDMAIIEPPLVGPGFEIAHPIIELRDGRWLSPLSTWRGWNGEAPNGIKTFAMVSSDQGRSWPKYIDIMDDYANGIYHWEKSVVQLADDRLLAVAWAFDSRSGKTRAVNYAVSEDGRTFSTPPRPTGLSAETSKLLVLPDGRVVCVFRGIDPPGLCATTVHLEGDRWHHDGPVPLWQGTGVTKMFGQSATGDELSNLKLGYPSPISLPGGDVLVAFWCCEDAVYNIRWVRFTVE